MEEWGGGSGFRKGEKGRNRRTRRRAARTDFIVVKRRTNGKIAKEKYA
jgi:hypothetical protein